MRTDAKLFTSLQVSLYEVFYSDSGDVDGYYIPKGQRLQTATVFLYCDEVHSFVQK